MPWAELLSPFAVLGLSDYSPLPGTRCSIGTETPFENSSSLLHQSHQWLSTCHSHWWYCGWGGSDVSKHRCQDSCADSGHENRTGSGYKGLLPWRRWAGIYPADHEDTDRGWSSCSAGRGGEKTNTVITHPSCSSELSESLHSRFETKTAHVFVQTCLWCSAKPSITAAVGGFPSRYRSVPRYCWFGLVTYEVQHCFEGKHNSFLCNHRTYSKTSCVEFKKWILLIHRKWNLS